MRICGLQKLTLLDYEGELAATIFTQGCEFRCPFCHNSSLIIENKNLEFIKEEEILDFLQGRFGKIDAVCITGGEPLLQKDLIEFIKKIKSIGYKVKLDTNGYLPDKLKEIINLNLIDYVAMDIKNSLTKYPLTAGIKDLDINRIKESIAILKKSNVPYEFRTTVVKEFHNADDFNEIAKLIKGTKKYYIQNYVDSADVLVKGLHGFSCEELEMFKATIEKHNIPCSIRGID